MGVWGREGEVIGDKVAFRSPVLNSMLGCWKYVLNFEKRCIEN